MKDSTKEVLYKPSNYEKILTGRKGEECSLAEGQLQETQKDINIHTMFGEGQVRTEI